MGVDMAQSTQGWAVRTSEDRDTQEAFLKSTQVSVEAGGG